MKTVILAGGLGTRLSEETEAKPKPMVEIGGMPILWHIMKIFGEHGYSEFIVALGYKGEVIKNFFLEYYHMRNNLTINLPDGKVNVHDGDSEDWTVHLVDTGLHTQTGGRLRRLFPWTGNETFMMTYGDGVADVDIPKLVDFHRGHKRVATVTAVRPPARFGHWICPAILSPSSPKSRKPKPAGSTAASSCSIGACSTTSTGTTAYSSAKL